MDRAECNNLPVAETPPKEVYQLADVPKQKILVFFIQNGLMVNVLFNGNIRQYSSTCISELVAVIVCEDELDTTGM